MLAFRSNIGVVVNYAMKSIGFKFDKVVT